MQRRLRRSVRWWTSFHRRLGGWWEGEDGAEHFDISKIKGWYLPGGDQWPHLTAAKWRREERGGWRLFSEPQPRLRHLGGDGWLVHWTKQSACSKLQPSMLHAGAASRAGAICHQCNGNILHLRWSSKSYWMLASLDTAAWHRTQDSVWMYDLRLRSNISLQQLWVTQYPGPGI